MRPSSLSTTAPGHQTPSASPRMFSCEVCLKTLSDEACPRHPHAERLQHSRTADAEWLNILIQRRTERRIRTVSTLGLIIGFIAAFTMSMGGLILMSMAVQFVFAIFYLGRTKSPSQPQEIEEAFSVVERSDAEIRMRRLAQYDRRISRTNRRSHSSRTNLGIGSH